MAVALADRVRPDVVLMGLSMPVMDGIEATRRIVAADPEAKVVVLNAYRTFSPTLAGIVDQFFTKNWIDAELRPSKDSGAFCH